MICRLFNNPIFLDLPDPLAVLLTGLVPGLVEVQPPLPSQLLHRHSARGHLRYVPEQIQIQLGCHII